MAFQILGIGTATPPHHIAQLEAAEWANSMSPDTSRHAAVHKLYRRVGVRTRHSVLLTACDDGIPAHQKLYQPARTAEESGPSIAARMEAYESSAGPLGIEAARKALNGADREAADITHLVTVSCSGFAAPGLDIALCRELALPLTIQRTHIGFMGCHGALNGLRVAKAFAESDPRACVLLCAVELCSLHHQYRGGADQIVANALFADGAAAVVGQSSRAGIVNKDPVRQLRATGSTIIPETEPYMTWQIRDHGFQMGLSPQVPAVIERELQPWLEKWLGSYGLSIDAIRNWAIHPGGPRILQACGNALNLSTEMLQTSHDILAEYGNMSSPTVLFIVDRLCRKNASGPCVMLAFGPGLTAEVALLDLAQQ